METREAQHNIALFFRRKLVNSLMMSSKEQMSSSQIGDETINDPISLFPIEPLRFPLDNSMRIVFTGYFNGFSVEVRSAEELALLYHMGCFGKGSSSRSKPKLPHSDGSSIIMRKRQFVMRNYWYKRFGGPIKSSNDDTFFKDVDELCTKILSDSKKPKGKDVIDLVSSDEEMSDAHHDFNSSNLDSFQGNDKDVAVIVPNSDSEEDNYFANLRPKCCLNKIKLQEKLMLTLQEAFFLLYGLGSLQIVNCDNKLLNIQQCWDLFSETESRFISKYVVYHYFRSKGYVVKPGIKFGGDYLLYKEGPGFGHAEFIVVVKHEERVDWISVLGHVRMSVTTVKDIIIAEVRNPSGDPPKLPEGLCAYSVREMLLSRKTPGMINDIVSEKCY